MANYSDIHKAVRVEKTRVWGGWLAGNIIMLMIARATQNITIVSTITQILAAAVFVALTVALIRMTHALNKRAERARRDLLGNDYPG